MDSSRFWDRRHAGQVLRTPLDLLLVRKLGLPGDPEDAMGALAEVNALVCARRPADFRAVSQG